MRRVREAVLVSQDSIIRKLSGGITVYPWQRFCEKLWACGFRELKRLMLQRKGADLRRARRARWLESLSRANVSSAANRRDESQAQKKKGH